MKSDFFESSVIATLGHFSTMCFIKSAFEIVDAGDRNSFTGLGSALAVPAAAKNNNIEDRSRIFFIRMAPITDIIKLSIIGTKLFVKRLHCHQQ
jgi:hypothetical protein